jgi:hypothetical protein
MMHNHSENIDLKNINNYNTNISVGRITALWAFSESAFGGILHALSIPFRGLFINAAAVLFISLIALFSKSSKDILKSTLIVILIKAVVSPYTPLAAYLAVSIQGILGYLFFMPKKYFRISALFLGMITVLFSGLQKIILLTVLFGNTLWKSINIFIKQVSKEFLNIDNPDVNYGYLLISIYLFIHLAAGIFIGIYAGFLPNKIKRYSKNIPDIVLENSEDTMPKKDKKRKKKIWLFRPTGIFIIVISLAVIIFSYLSPAINDNTAIEIVIMIIRSIVLTIIWFVLLAPVVKKIFQKYISKRKSNYTKELDEIISMFPQFKKIVAYCWSKSSNKKGFKRIHYFLSTSFYYLLLRVP